MDEHFISRTISEYAKNAGVAFDIGANVGKYCKELSDKFARVYAFEPHPANLEKLRKHIEKEKLSNIVVIPKAISDVTKTSYLYTAGAGGHSLSKVVAERERWGHKPDKHIDVECITIDDFVEERKITDLRFMKVDIEGAESFIFKGAINTLKNFDLTIMLEVHQTVECHKLWRFFHVQGYEWTDPKGKIVDDLKNDQHYRLTKKESN